ncbi:MAG: NAD-dependent epimerase/dehydratase family protein [Sulfolobaceae archaeon]
MKILVLGLGFIATHIAEYFSSKAEVIVTYRNLNPIKKVYLELLASKGVNSVKLDPISNTTELRKIIKDSDVIINCIGEISGDVNKLRISNFEIPKLIANIIKEIGNKKIILFHLSASTYGITGSVKLEEPLGYGLKPSNEFERTKLEGEKVVYSIAKESGFSAVILRPTLVYGKYAAHIQYVNIYKLAKRGIIPLLHFRFQPISAKYIAMLIEKFIESREKTVLIHTYVTECELIDLVDMIEAYSDALNVKRRLKIPIPKRLALLALPKEIRSLLKYEGTIYDCSKVTELLGSIKFDKSELYSNAKFLKELDERGILVPT